MEPEQQNDSRTPVEPMVMPQTFIPMGTNPMQSEVEPKMPRWVKITFRFFAIIFLIGTLWAGIELVSSSVNSIIEISNNVLEESETVSTLATSVFLTLGVVILILQTIFVFAVFKLKRWVLPITVFFSASILLISLFSLINSTYAHLIQLISILVGVLIAAIIGYSSVKYWSEFGGSARNLKIQIPLILAFLPFVLFVLVGQIFPDDKSIDDGDLLLEPAEVLPQAENAHYFIPIVDDLSVSEAQAYETALQYLKAEEPENLDQQTLFNLVTQTKAQTDSFIEASRKRGYQCPTLINDYSPEAELCNLITIRDLALLTALRAEVEAVEGKTEESIESSISIIRLGYLLSSSEQPHLFEQLAGIIIMKVGMNSFENTLGSLTKTNQVVLERALSELETYELDGTEFVKTIKREYVSMKETLEQLEQFQSYFYYHNQTMSDLAEVSRRQINISLTQCGSEFDREVDSFEEYFREEYPSLDTFFYMSPNSIGNILYSVTFASLNDFTDQKCVLNEQNELLQKRITEEINQSL